LNLPTLTDGRIISRYKRFLADVELYNGEIVTAHCPNTGSMQGCWEAGAPVQLSASDNPKRKLRWTLERVDMGAGWIGVNTNRVNAIMSDFINDNAIPGLTGYSEFKREPAYNVDGFDRSRFDILLNRSGRQPCFVEIKNTTLFRNQEIQFPDAKTSRGKKHLELLQHAAKNGYRSVMLFAVNRPEGDLFRVAKDIDPTYHQTLIESSANGVDLIAFRIRHTPTGVEPGECVAISLD
jgi:sugar fermentation stimulation protein A